MWRTWRSERTNCLHGARPIWATRSSLVRVAKGRTKRVAAARAGAKVSFISKLGEDAFGEMARTLYRAEGINTRHLLTSSVATGGGGDPYRCAKWRELDHRGASACFELSPEEVSEMEGLIADSSVFVTQLELALPTVEYGLKLARVAGSDDDTESCAGTRTCRNRSLHTVTMSRRTKPRRKS